MPTTILNRPRRPDAKAPRSPMADRAHGRDVAGPAVLPFVRRPPTLEVVREEATDRVAAWLFGLLDRAPGIIPERAAPDADRVACATELRRFVRDVLSRNPVTRAPLANVQAELIGLALDCVDWHALAGHPRLRALDWPGAYLIRP